MADSSCGDSPTSPGWREEFQKRQQHAAAGRLPNLPEENAPAAASVGDFLSQMASKAASWLPQQTSRDDEDLAAGFAPVTAELNSPDKDSAPRPGARRPSPQLAWLEEEEAKAVAAEAAPAPAPAPAPSAPARRSPPRLIDRAARGARPSKSRDCSKGTRTSPTLTQV